MKAIATAGIFFLIMGLYLPRLLDGQGAHTAQNVALTPSKKKGPKIARAYRDSAGHFSFNARLNGNHEKVLVDTGASIVAINWTTARRIGIELGAGDFTHEINTANGRAKMARARINEIRIDGITLRNVDAAVLHDTALSGTLLGMSFLNRLKRFEIENQTLKLTQ